MDLQQIKSAGLMLGRRLYNTRHCIMFAVSSRHIAAKPNHPAKTLGSPGISMLVQSRRRWIDIELVSAK